MAGSRKWVIYVADPAGLDAQGDPLASKKYAVNLDESNAEIVGLGFDDYNATSAIDVEGTLPKGLEMRYVNVIEPTSGATRKIYIGKPGLAGGLAGATMLLGLFGGSTVGSLVNFAVRGFVGEKRTVAFAFDTGLNDGDAT